MTNCIICAIIYLLFTEGEWCNGNTWVSKTFVEGSSPSSPAERESLETLMLQGFSCIYTLLSARKRCTIIHLILHHFPYLFSTFFLKLPSITLKELSGNARRRANSWRRSVAMTAFTPATRHFTFGLSAFRTFPAKKRAPPFLMMPRRLIQIERLHCVFFQRVDHVDVDSVRDLRRAMPQQF